MYNSNFGYIALGVIIGCLVVGGVIALLLLFAWLALG